MTPETAAAAPTRRPVRSPAGEWIGRFMLAHMLAYPVGFVAAVAAMPAVFLRWEDDFVRMGPEGAKIGVVRMSIAIVSALLSTPITATEAAVIESVIVKLLIIAGVVMTLVHVAVIPWANAQSALARGVNRGEDPRPLLPAVDRGVRMFRRVTATTTLVALLAGVVGWTWFFAT